jgi:hypothetical protein
MRGTGLGTSLFLIAVGAVLAFGITARTNGIDVNTIGFILMLVGILGLIMSFMFLEGWTSFAGPHRDTVVYDNRDSDVVPHQHRRVRTTDTVYEDEDGDTYVERERRISR